MGFRGFSFPSHLPSFVPHSAVQAYLEAFALRHALVPLVSFNAEVVHAAPVMEKDGAPEGLGPAWDVTFTQGDIPPVRQRFDFLVAATGHFATQAPFMPSIPGLDTFDGAVTHSCWCT